MSALGHYLEDEGIATTGVSLVREHTAGYRPPRALWVPFPFGRPFGAPGDAAFQHRVLDAALALLERVDGPVILEDFPDDAPGASAAGDGEEVAEGWVCPVAFPSPPEDPRDRAAALAREVDRLAPWYALARERRGRTTFGVTGLDATAVARFVAAFLDAPPAAFRPSLPLGANLKLACEDLKAYYLEAAAARPGAPAAGLEAWFWGETTAARVLLDLAGVLATSDDASLRTLASDYLVPRAQARRLAP